MEGWSGGDGRLLAGDPAAAGDADVARAWADGDPRAFEEAYRRFAPALFGTAVGLLGDRTAASDVVHDTFVRAAPRVAGLREPDRLRAWLFAILRNEAASHHRARRYDGGSLDDPAGGAMSERLVDGAAPADVEASRAELADLVWTAAEGLQDRDREVLELNVRGGLDTADLADALGVTPGHAAVLLSRMRDRLERCLGALVVARVGRRDCDALDRLLDGWDGRFSLEIRSKVTRHVESCLRCGRQRAALVSMERLAPALLPPVVLLPTDLRARLVASLGPDGRGAGAGGDQAWGWRDDGFPEQSAQPVRRPVDDGGAPEPVAAAGTPGGAALLGGPPPGAGRTAGFVGAHRMRRGRARPVAVLAGLAVLLLGGGGLVVAGLLRPDPGSVQVRVVGTSAPAAGSSSATPSPAGPASDPVTLATSTPPTGSPSAPTSPPARRTTPTSTTPTSTTTTTTTTPPTRSDPPTRTTPPSRSTPPTSRTPTPPAPVIDRLAASPAEVFVAGNCQPQQAMVTVAFTASGRVTVTGTWSPDGKTTNTLDVTSTGSVRTATVGPYRTARTDTVSVTVSDQYGSVTRSVAVTSLSCVG